MRIGLILTLGLAIFVKLKAQLISRFVKNCVLIYVKPFSARSERKVAKMLLPVCLCVCPHVATQEALNEFS
jgi:hypothetical protein